MIQTFTIIGLQRGVLGVFFIGMNRERTRQAAQQGQ